MSGWWALACVAYGLISGGAIGAAAVGIHYRRRAERVQRAMIKPVDIERTRELIARIKQR